jgi:hypothetical protein
MIPAPESFGWSPRDRGTYWIRTESGLRNVYRDRTRFRYALRNEHGIPSADADRIVAECDRQKATR